MLTPKQLTARNVVQKYLHKARPLATALVAPLAESLIDQLVAVGEAAAQEAVETAAATARAKIEELLGGHSEAQTAAHQAEVAALHARIKELEEQFGVTTGVLTEPNAESAEEDHESTKDEK